ncbi:hypothetical protein [Dactylosporangium sp. CA-139066]|uniref:hypothetical protein n=1 Tax=Dactylosporangium sp. CA-139066 TaxID=3239930 RepID=UPI003D915AF4
MDEIRTAALSAVAEVPAEYEGQGRVIRATKIVRDRTGCPLRDAIDAVNWALDRPPAATLPAHSIVGSAHAAWFKEARPGQSHNPWVSTHTEQYHSDAEIDDLLRTDRATILRVGGGS